MIRKFMQEFKVSNEEAYWYLEDNEYNYKVAAETRQADVEWEKSHKQGKSVSLKAWSCLPLSFTCILF